MARYLGNEAYDITIFEPRERMVKAPTPKQQINQKPKLIKHKKTKSEIKSEMRLNIKNSTKVFIVSAICFVFISSLIYSRVNLDELTRDISSLQAEIEIEQSETIRLKMALNSKVSVERIEDYAENVLGMVKLEAYHADYIDLSSGDEIVISGGKTLKDRDSLSAFKEFLAYIYQ